MFHPRNLDANGMRSSSGPEVLFYGRLTIAGVQVHSCTATKHDGWAHARNQVCAPQADMG